MNFREWLNYVPPPEWVQLAMKPLTQGIAGSLGAGYQHAADRQGIKGVGASDQFSSLTYSKENDFMGRMTPADKERLNITANDSLIEAPRYFLIKTRVMQATGAMNTAITKVFSLPQVASQINKGNMEKDKVKAYPYAKGTDEFGSPVITYAIKIGKE